MHCMNTSTKQCEVCEQEMDELYPYPEHTLCLNTHVVERKEPLKEEHHE